MSTIDEVIGLDLSTLKWSRTATYSVDAVDPNTHCGTEGYYGIAATVDNDFAEANLFADETMCHVERLQRMSDTKVCEP